MFAVSPKSICERAVKIQSDFNISRGKGTGSGKLRLSSALAPLKLRSEGGKKAEAGRSFYVAVAEVDRGLGKKSMFCLFGALGF